MFLGVAPAHDKSGSEHGNYCVNINVETFPFHLVYFCLSVNLMRRGPGAILMFQELSVFVVYLPVLINL